MPIVARSGLGPPRLPCQAIPNHPGRTVLRSRHACRVPAPPSSGRAMPSLPCLAPAGRVRPGRTLTGRATPAASDRGTPFLVVPFVAPRRLACRVPAKPDLAPPEPAIPRRACRACVVSCPTSPSRDQTTPCLAIRALPAVSRRTHRNHVVPRPGRPNQALPRLACRDRAAPNQTRPSLVASCHVASGLACRALPLRSEPRRAEPTWPAQPQLASP